VSAVPAPLARARTVRRLPVAFALARVEVRKLLLHPASIIGALIGLPLAVTATWHHTPVLDGYDALTHEALIPFACGVLIAAHLGAMRARRNRTTELYETVASSEATVTSGHLIAVVGAAGFAALLVIAQLIFFVSIGGVRTPRPEVLLLGPALVAFSGAFGVALGRWAPRLFAAPVALAGIVAACAALLSNSLEHHRDWLSLWVPSETWSGTPAEFSLRPYGWHLVYLIGLAGIVAAIALTKHRSARPVALPALVVLVVGTAFAGRQETARVPRADKIAIANSVITELEHHTCETRGGVEYCALTGYEPWVDRWQDPIDGVLGAVPDAARTGQLRVWQFPSETFIADEYANPVIARMVYRARRDGSLARSEDIKPSLSWGRNWGRDTNELALAILTATRATGIDFDFPLTPATLKGVPHPREFARSWRGQQPSCSSLNQGRAIVALWLAAQSTEGSRRAFQAAAASSPFTGRFVATSNMFVTPQQWTLEQYTYELLGQPEVTWGTREATYVSQLLERDDDDVRAAIAADWDRLVDPSTSSDQAAGILGLKVLPSLKEAFRNSDRGFRSETEYPKCL
jgi:hypothetical protein